MILCTHNLIPAERKLLSIDGNVYFSGSIQEVLYRLKDYN